jgi:hypothetical protein
LGREHFGTLEESRYRDLLEAPATAQTGSGRPSGPDDLPTRSRWLNAGVRDFFEDVADLDRETGYLQSPLIAATGLPTQVEIEFAEEIEWTSEGHDIAARLGDPIVLRARCTAFWWVCSDGGLSFQMGFGIDYPRKLRHFIALAALQQGIETMQASSWPDFRDDDGNGVSPLVAAAGVPRFPYQRLPEFLQSALRHAWRQLREWALVGPTAARGGRTRSTSEHDQSAGILTRWMCVFEDEVLYDALRRRKSSAAQGRDGDAADLLKDALDALSDDRHREPASARIVYEPEALARWERTWSPEVQSLLFLSGFSKQVQDFLRQDHSEVSDGSEPIYPPSESREESPYWLLLASKSAAYEVVRSSRSVELGRDYIGTCPYLLLVHLLVLHDESLTRQLQGRVEALVDQTTTKLPSIGRQLKSDPYQATQSLKELLYVYRQERMLIFAEVERFAHDNVFRYRTEQAFFALIEEGQGIRQRRERWTRLLGQLSDVLDEESKSLDEEEQAGLNRALGAVALLGIFQTLTLITGALKEWGAWFKEPPGSSIRHVQSVVFAIDLALAIALVYLLIRYRRLISRIFSRLSKGAKPRAERARWGFFRRRVR